MGKSRVVPIARQYLSFAGSSACEGENIFYLLALFDITSACVSPTIEFTGETVSNVVCVVTGSGGGGSVLGTKNQRNDGSSWPFLSGEK